MHTIDYIGMRCPSCLTSPESLNLSICNCGYNFPLMYIIVGEPWDFSEELMDNFKKYTGLRLLTSYIGNNPSRIAELEHLQYLYISKHKRFKFQYLYNLKNLRTLILDSFSFDNLLGIEYISNLTDLQLVDCHKLKDITSLSLSSSIKALHFTICNKVTDYSPLSNMKQLEIFRTDTKEIQSLYFLQSLEQLKELVLASQKIINNDILPIMNLTKLEKLYFNHKLFKKDKIKILEEHYSNCDITIW